MRPSRLEDGTRAIERWNDVFEALSAEPRRQLVISLLDSDGPVSLPEAATDPNAPVNHDQLRLELYHQHLPLLETHEFVEWERDPLEARRGARFEEIGVVIETLRGRSESSPDPLATGYQRLLQKRRDVAEEP